MITAMGVAVPGFAQDADQPLQYGGFGTIGVMGTDSHLVSYPRDTSQPTGAIDQLNFREDSRLGLQGRLRLADNLFATLQVVSKYRYDGSFKPDVTWATLAWNPVSNLQLQAGRMGFDMFEKSMVRDVGYTYLWVRPPTEVFASVPFQLVDGLRAEQTFVIGSDTTFSLKGLAARTVGKTPYFGVDAVQNGTGGGVFGLTASLQQGPWRIRGSIARVKNVNELPAPLSQIPAIFDDLAAITHDPELVQTGALYTIMNLHSRTLAFGVNYDEGPVQAAGYISRSTFDKFLLPKTTTGYLSLGYRLEAVVPYLMYARMYSDRIQTPYLGVLPFSPNPAVQQFTSMVTTMAETRNADQHTWSAGFRWDFSSHADLKLQVDRVSNVTGAPLMYTQQPGFGGKLTVMSLVLDFVFGGRRP
jgi:hypothetical protein